MKNRSSSWSTMHVMCAWTMESIHVSPVIYEQDRDAVGQQDGADGVGQRIRLAHSRRADRAVCQRPLTTYGWLSDDDRADHEPIDRSVGRPASLTCHQSLLLHPFQIIISRFSFSGCINFTMHGMEGVANFSESIVVLCI